MPRRGPASSLYFPFRSPAVGEIRRFLRENRVCFVSVHQREESMCRLRV